MKRLFLFLLLVAIIVGGVFFYRLQPPEITVITPHRGKAVQAVYATGTVEATVMMPIAPRISARLRDLKADEGSEVKKDDVLAILEDDDLQSAVGEKRARLSQASREFERNRKMLSQNAVSRGVYDRALAELETARATVKMAQVQADFTRLTAPADGHIIRRDGEIGQLISANQPLFWMSCCAPLRISAEVDEEDIALVQPGQKVLIRADAFPGKIYHGTVSGITPKGDPVARSYRVRIGFDDATPLLIGMTAEANIITQEKHAALLIPTSAVVGESVWIVGKNGKLTPKTVTIGIRGEEEVEVLSGLSETDKIAATPNAEATP